MPVRPTRQNNKKARGDGVVGQLRGHQRGEVERDLAVELAFAVLALVKTSTAARRRAGCRGFVARMSSRILKPCEESDGASVSKTSRRIMKWPLIGSVRSMPSSRRTRVFEAADAGALFRQAGGGAAVEIAAGDREIAARRRAGNRAWRRADLRRAAGRRPSPRRSAPGLPACLRGRRRRGRGGRCGECSARGCRSRRWRARRRRCRRENCRRRTRPPSRRPASRRESRSTRIGILARSLKVGTTMLSSGAGRSWRQLPARGRRRGRSCG